MSYSVLHFSSHKLSIKLGKTRKIEAIGNGDRGSLVKKNGTEIMKKVCLSRLVLQMYSSLFWVYVISCDIPHQTHLSWGGEWGSIFQQHDSNILVSFTWSQVKGGVAWGGGSVGRGAALQQLLDDVDFPQPTGDMQRCLVILQGKRGWLFVGILALCFFLPDIVIDNEGHSFNLGLGLHFRSILEQVSDYVRLTCPGCHMESCLTSLKRPKKTVVSGSFQMRDMNLQ